MKNGYNDDLGFDGTHSFVVKLALDLPSPLGRLAVCHAGVAERQLEAKGRRGALQGFR
jgi:hypothetical protein